MHRGCVSTGRIAAGKEALTLLFCLKQSTYPPRASPNHHCVIKGLLSCFLLLLLCLSELLRDTWSQNVPGHPSPEPNLWCVWMLQQCGDTGYRVPEVDEILPLHNGTRRWHIFRAHHLIKLWELYEYCHQSFLVSSLPVMRRMTAEQAQGGKWLSVIS